MIRPRGVVSELYPNFVGYIACEHSFTGTHPVLLLSVASNISITGRRLRALTRASYRASLAYLACEARRRGLLFEARLR